MTQQEFNEKYKQYIPKGWYGLHFDIPEVTKYLDEVMQDLIHTPGFELHQIKLKFGMCRFYATYIELELQHRIENDVNKIIKENGTTRTNILCSNMV